MKVTQISNPFSPQISTSKSSGLWIILGIIAIIGVIGYYLYREGKLHIIDGKLSFNL